MVSVGGAFAPNPVFYEARIATKDAPIPPCLPHRFSLPSLGHRFTQSHGRLPTGIPISDHWRGRASQELQRWLIALLKPTEVFLYVASLPFPTMREPRAQQVAYDPQDSSHL
jgi:hypothetical protein